MTRCSCSKNVCRPSTSFFYKVLSSLKQLQTSHKKYCNGAGLEDITKFIDKTYSLTGDLLSQVENALGTAESCRFVVKKKNLYALVSPAATLQFTPGPCVKAKLERIQEIFNSKWCEDSDTKRRSNRRPRRNSHSPLHFISPIQASQQMNGKKGISKSATKKSEPKRLRKPVDKKSVPDTSSVKSSPLTPLTSSLAKYLKTSFKSCMSSSKGEVVNHGSSALSSKENVCTPCSSKNSSKKTAPSASSSRGSLKRACSSSSMHDLSNKKKCGGSSHRRKKKRSSKKPSKKKRRPSTARNSPTNEDIMCSDSNSASNQMAPVANDDSDSDSSEC